MTAPAGHPRPAEGRAAGARRFHGELFGEDFLSGAPRQARAAEPVLVAVLGSGSSGNATLVRHGGTAVLVDAGLSAKRLEARVAECGTAVSRLDAILLTHEHQDHAAALRVLCKKYPVPLYANPLTADAVRHAYGVASARWSYFRTGAEFAVGSLTFRSFSVPHDAADPVGFVARAGGASFAVVTDLGMPTRSVVENIRGVSGIFVETNYDEDMLASDTKRPWSVKQRIASRHGHLSNAAAAQLVAEAATPSLQAVILGHLSADCNTPERARETVLAALRERDFHGVPVSCAPRDSISGHFAFR